MMITAIPPLAPGHGALCQSCLHYIPGLESHPSPCRCVRWEGHRHVKPTLKCWDDGAITCSDFEPAEIMAPEAGGGE
jgi:hypothetical protein